MPTQTLTRLANIFHAIAIGASTAAALLFAYTFATDGYLDYQLGLYFTAAQPSLVLPVYLGILLAVFVGYAIASKKQSSRTGGLVAIAAVLALYAWCQFSFDHALSPLLLVLAAPAVCHLMVDKLELAAVSKQVESATDDALQPSPTEVAETPAVPARELAVGAA